MNSSFYKLDGVRSVFLLYFFLLKLVASGIVWMYFYYKPGFGSESDMYQFFNTAAELHKKLTLSDELRILFNLPQTDAIKETLISVNYWSKLYDYGFLNDNRIMIRINLFIHLFSNGSYLFHSLCFSFLGFNGIFYLVKIIPKHTQRPLSIIALILFTLPSGLIWTSSVFKESLLLFSLGGTCYFLVCCIQGTRKTFHFLSLLFFSLLLIQTKPLFSLLFLYSFACYGVFFLLKVKFPKLPFAGIFLIPLLTSILVASMATSTKKDLTVKEGFTFNIPLILKNKQADFFYDVNALSPHTVLKLNRMDGSYRSILLTIPDALKNIFLAPFILAPKKWEMIPFAIENMLLIILITFSKLAPLAIDNRLNTFFQALLFPSWLSLLVIGLILPMAGLIVKYASPAILICTLYYGLKIDWIRLRNTKLINLK